MAKKPLVGRPKPTEMPAARPSRLPGLVGVALVRKSLPTRDHSGLARSHTIQRKIAAGLRIPLDAASAHIARHALLPVLELSSFAIGRSP